MNDDYFRKCLNKAISIYAGVVELAYTTDSKSVAGNGLRVRLPPPANFMWYGGKGRRMAVAVSGRISVDLSG